MGSKHYRYLVARRGKVSDVVRHLSRAASRRIHLNDESREQNGTNIPVLIYRKTRREKDGGLNVSR